MAKYRKKPVVIEAFQYDGDLIDRNGNPYVPAWAMDAFKARVLFSVADYIIRGVQGEIYPCKPDIFEATYERVDAE